MLILVAVTINMAVNGGLFGYAGNAARETEIEKQKENDRYANVASNLTTDGLIDYYTKGEPVLATFIWTGDSGSDGPYEVTFEEGMTWAEWIDSDYNPWKGNSSAFVHSAAIGDDYEIVYAFGWMLASPEDIPRFSNGRTFGAIIGTHQIIAGVEYCYYPE